VLYKVLISDALKRRLAVISPEEMVRISTINPHVGELIRAAERAEAEPPPVLPKLFDLSSGKY
jgi:hypothetical protein